MLFSLWSLASTLQAALSFAQHVELIQEADPSENKSTSACLCTTDPIPPPHTPKTTHCNFLNFLICFLQPGHYTTTNYLHLIQGRGQGCMGRLQHLMLAASFYLLYISLWKDRSHTKSQSFWRIKHIQNIPPFLPYRKFSFTNGLKETTYRSCCVLENVTKLGILSQPEQVQPAFTNTSRNT